MAVDQVRSLSLLEVHLIAPSMDQPFRLPPPFGRVEPGEYLAGVDRVTGHLGDVGRKTAVVFSVFQVNGKLINWGDSFCQPLGLTSARWQVLGAIATAPQFPNIPQIAAAMGQTRQGVLKQINLLVNDGLVQPQHNPTHKRSHLYALTEKGQSVAQSLEQDWQTHVREIAPQFTAADLEAAVRVMSAMSRIYDDTR